MKIHLLVPGARIGQNCNLLIQSGKHDLVWCGPGLVLSFWRTHRYISAISMARLIRMAAHHMQTLSLRQLYFQTTNDVVSTFRILIINRCVFVFIPIFENYEPNLCFLLLEIIHKNAAPFFYDFIQIKEDEEGEWSVLSGWRLSLAEGSLDRLSYSLGH